ncbi:MAG: hypothetical protein E5Y07_18660 [Mesorhizobium sp.]|nr:MAG: hypothetical protein E5Y07_18660 [Mesorhizobium sp.]
MIISGSDSAIADLTTNETRGEFSIALEDMACAWATALSDGKRPASWSVYDRLQSRSMAGIVVPSFAPSAEMEDRNLVLWDWGPDLPHKVAVFDPSGRLPKDQLSLR